VRREIEQNFGSDRLYDEGMKVYTTVNLEMQQMARQAVDKGLTDLPPPGVLRADPAFKSG
jgi:penicillin-binding protein 1A